MASHSVGLWLLVMAMAPSTALAQVDGLLAIPSRAQARGRMSPDTARPIARYRMDLPLAGRAPEEVLAEEFGWAAEQLELVSESRTAGSSHLTFQQVVRGVPVWNRKVTISLNASRSISMVMSGFDHDVRDSQVNTSPTISGAQSVERALKIQTRSRTGPPELVVVPGSPPRLAWRIWVWPLARMEEREMLIDAHSGELLLDVDRTARTKPTGAVRPPLRGDSGAGRLGQGQEAGPAGPSQGKALAPQGRGGTVRMSAAARVDGIGQVFDPDPLATSGSAYVPPFVDDSDADNPDLTAQLRTVTLRDISLGTDGVYRLEGPSLRIIGENSGGVKVYDPPEETTPNFEYTRSRPGFEAVNVYHHIDANQRYVQSLGFSDLQSQSPLPVNPAGSADDNSGWLASQRYLFFGTGGVDDGEDVAVILHEYAHALLEAGSPGLRSSLEGQAFHEGWADYWAMSYQRSLIDAGLMVRTDWEEVFRWDSGLGSIWAGRRLDFSGTYPQDTCSDDGAVFGCVFHDDGRLWGTVMMNIFSELGRDVTDRLNLYSHKYLSPGVTFPDAAEAVIQADVDHFAGAHVEALVAHFASFGLVDPASFGPIMSHTELVSGEPVTGTRAILVTARALSATVNDVSLHYRYDDGPLSEIALSGQGGDTYSGDLPLPGRPATVSYFLRAVDNQNRESLLPDQAPNKVFSFEVGIDTQAPTITHTPIGQISLFEWPPVVTALVRDNLGVSSVRVDYEMTVPGQPVVAASFALSHVQDRFVGGFDIPLNQIAIGTRLSYTIEAIDIAAVSNRELVGPFEFEVSGEGVLRTFDSRGAQSGVLTSGAFSAGAPAFGTRVAHSDNSVWGINLSGPYAAEAGVSSLVLPALNLVGATTPQLEFWHWYDTEHDGRADPGTTGGEVLWDGGNIKISVDRGVTWSIAQPRGGYTGVIVGGPDNPMAGQSAFGGFSYAWRREIIDLPAESDLLIRFDFGTDATNSEVSEDFAGWLLDDIQVTTTVVPGPEAPHQIGEIALTGFFPSGQPLPTFGLQARDDTGISDAWIDYSYEGSIGSESATVRLTQSPNSLLQFGGQILANLVPAPGDLITWRFRVRDVDGNESTIPNLGGPPFERDIRLSEVRSVLESASGSGTWAPEGSEWEASGSDMGSLVLAPISVPANSAASRLVFAQSHRFSPGAGGRVELSSDDGHTWLVVSPDPGYPGEAAGEGAFVGRVSAGSSLLNLAPWAGEVVQVRFVGVGNLGTSDFWRLATVSVQHQTNQESFDLPDQVLLHANYPDPFNVSTNIGYSLPEPSSVTLVLYDLLGRRVSIVDSGPRDAGNHMVSLRADGIAAGSYILRLQTDQATLTEMVVISR